MSTERQRIVWIPLSNQLISILVRLGLEYGGKAGDSLPADSPFPLSWISFFSLMA
jgi:hypothetical protein